MKSNLRELYKNNKRDFNVWNYLWLFSESNQIEFTHKELCLEFDLPPSTLHRVIHNNIELFNTEDKVFVEYEKKSYRDCKISFYPKGKKYGKPKEDPLYDELYSWMKQYYEDIGFDYADLSKHKRYIKTICTKLKKAMKKKNTETTSESLSATFQFFISSIDDWWKESGNITLPLISKHFTKLLNQAKTNGTKKSDSYSKAASEVDGIDFDKFTRKK